MSNIPGQEVRTRLTRAMSLMQSGQWTEAEDICQKLLRQTPTLVDANYFLGMIFQNTRQFERAILCYEAVIRQVSGHPDALNNLGTVYESLKNTTKALDCYRRAVRHNPGHVQAQFNLGRTLRIAGQPGEASACLTAALALSPDSAQILYESGLALKALGQLEKSLDCLQRARELSPVDPAIVNVIGNVFQLQGEISRAIDAYRKAITLKADFASAYNNLGSSLIARGDVPAALENYRTASRLSPEWSGAASNVLLARNYISDDAEGLFQEHRQYGALLESRFRESTRTSSKVPGEKIRVGYVSPDFRNHSVAYFLQALFLYHDDSRFEVVCFSDVASSDGMTQELRSLVSEWHNIYGLSDAEVFMRIQDCHIDILVDLTGHTSHNRLSVFAMQAAPAQVSYLGYPNTTGLTTIQYRITDCWADPPGKSDVLHTEKLIRLPECFLCYTPPTECPEIKDLPADTNGFVTYGSFNVLAKISDACINAWSTVLRQSPDSRLVLKSAGLQDQATREYIYHRFMAHAVAADRVDLIARTASFRSHMDLYNRIDISLDTFPYNGTTTSCESLWMGVPVLTLAGTRHAGRVGASLLHQVGLDEFVANDIGEYCAKAGQLVNDLDQLRALRRGLRATVASSPLCDGAMLASSMENEYTKLLC